MESDFTVHSVDINLLFVIAIWCENKKEKPHRKILIAQIINVHIVNLAEETENLWAQDELKDNEEIPMIF